MGNQDPPEKVSGQVWSKMSPVRITSPGWPPERGRGAGKPLRVGLGGKGGEHLPWVWGPPVPTPRCHTKAGGRGCCAIVASQFAQLLETNSEISSSGSTQSCSSRVT